MKLMIKILSTIIIYFILSFQNLYAQKIASFEISFENNNNFSIPAKINLDNITFLHDSLLVLNEVIDDKRTAIPFQISNGEFRTLHWLINNTLKHNNNQFYELIKQEDKTSYPKMKIEKNNGTLTITHGDSELLGYQYKTVYPPIGIDTAYKRSGFIHPLFSPHGQVLTQIQPVDHYHHYGIWNPWTHVLFEKDTVDFWNLAKREGTVLFNNIVSIDEGPIFAEFKTLHEHVVFKESEKDIIALTELQTVRVYNSANPDNYIIDFIIELNCATESSLVLLEYRYGGFSWRATEEWDSKNSQVLTSEGKNRNDADGSRARWVIIQGDIENDYAGIVMMSYPTNYNHPEPLRIWPEDQNGKGDVFANFSPTKNKDWELKPGKTYTLKYRLFVFNGHMDKVTAESAWQSFAKENIIEIIK
jgi:hypothetical protein